MTTDETTGGVDNLLTETRTFAPDPEFAAQANAGADLYDTAAADTDAFWLDQARDLLTWRTEPTQSLDWSGAPVARWFADGTLNACENAVDRHVAAGHGDRVAIHFEGEPGDRYDLTYAELLEQVSRAAGALEALGVTTGDRVAIYLPMIPEAVVAMLACARIGAVHSVVFGGFSADALHSRIIDGDARLVVTADGGWRRGKQLPLKRAVDDALAKGGTNVEHVLVVRRTGQETDWTEGRDVEWAEALAAAPAEHEPVAVEAEHPLFLLYTSGTTGKPKGILHTTGGYLTQSQYTFHNVFDHKAGQDVFWCTADVGWVTGHSYVVYGPLSDGVTQVLYEGTPDTPHQGRWWEIVERYGVTLLYTSPTAIRTCMKWGEDVPGKFDLSSLRLLGTVGEPINPEAWMWYRRVIGAERTPVVDTWWQTETGAIMIAPLPGVTSTQPGSATKPLPGISAEILDDAGKAVTDGQGGYLALTAPWPAMTRGIWGDEQRFVDTYWSRFPGSYFAGDGARKDDEGDIWFLGRVDDVMNVSGHRLSTTEIESSLVSHPKVAEAAVVGAKDDTTGQAVVAFVILRGDALQEADEPGEGSDVVGELRAHVAAQIGPIARPRTLHVVAELPKTRSGKIMRRLLRDVAEGRDAGDVTTLADTSVMDQITRGMQQD
ncbi:acetate--CoA ligase [Georgenia sp. Z1491]|uniref:acetate--CoA ligase n=1 Tax=Georgenia sp. Z1491 TaxID=3416707 RepID=UPI003CEA5153